MQRKLSAQSLQIRLDEMFNAFLRGELDRGDLQTAANATGKILAPSMGQLKYHQLRDEPPNLEFFKEDKVLAKAYRSNVPDQVVLKKNKPRP